MSHKIITTAFQSLPAKIFLYQIDPLGRVHGDLDQAVRLDAGALQRFPQSSSVIPLRRITRL